MDLDPSILWDFAGEVVGTIKQRPKSVPATVSRIDADGTAWVTTGDGMEVPAATSSVGLSVGDVVDAEWSGATMRITGNSSDPSAGVRTVNVVRRMAVAARTLAKDAKAVAEATGQFFWHDDNGAHVSTEKDNPTGPQNALWNSLGMLFRQGSNILLAIVTGDDPGMDIYDGQGNEDENVIASYRGSGVRVGRADECHQELDYRSMKLVDKEDSTYFRIEDLRDDDGTVTVEYTYRAGRVQIYYALPVVVDSSTVTVTVDGIPVTEGWTIETIFDGTENERTRVVFDGYKRPETGSTVVVSGKVTDAAIARTMKVYTLGVRGGSNAGRYSLTTGSGNSANGVRSQAHGHGTVADYADQAVFGRYNESIPENAFEIGNGSADYGRSNAMSVDWDGNLWAGNFRDWSAYIDRGSGTAHIQRVGSILIFTGHLSNVSISTLETYDWITLASATLPPDTFSSFTSLGTYVDVSGGGPSYQGSTNAGGWLTYDRGNLYASMQSNVDFSNKHVRFVMMALVS